ncbi:MAG: ATP-binding cassette, subfamily bacterial, partial [Gaiellaceae bacterium]|nr:ATP-binding cassette, subfamily bacterial [Gaiellaceae bacterium]
MSSAAIEVQGLAKHFPLSGGSPLVRRRVLRAVDDVSFELRPGNVTALVGESGSGKSTVARLISRLYEPTEGRIMLDGIDLKKWDAKDLRARVGVIFQDYNKYPFTLGENV